MRKRPSAAASASEGSSENEERELSAGEEGAGDEAGEAKPGSAPEVRRRAEFDPLKNAPKLVLVQGPPRSGKTTLIRSLVKHYTNQSLPELRGPVTVKTSKRQRLTLLECPNDLSPALDLAKVADVVLLCVDVSVGFEMESFEFLAALQVHGFPRCVAIGTHLDRYPFEDKKRRVKRALRKRLEKEVTKETNFFFVSGMRRGFYAFRDVHNLARLLSVINPRETEFKATHPHLLVDRVEMLGAEGVELRGEDRVDVACFGYVRGGELAPQGELWVCGLGLLQSATVAETSDPVPLNQLQQRVKESEPAAEGAQPQQMRKFARSLRKRERLLYAPMSDVGLLLFDETGDYVRIPEGHVFFTEQPGQSEELALHEGVRMVRSLQSGAAAVDLQLQRDDLELVSGVKLAEEQSVPAVEETSAREVERLAARVALQAPLASSAGQSLHAAIYGGEAGATSAFDCSRFFVVAMQDREFYRVHARANFAAGTEVEGSEDSEAEREYVNEAVGDEQPTAEGQLAKGKYVKVIIRGLRLDTFQHFSSAPVVLSQPLRGETGRGFLLVRFKRHRWFSGLLKSVDPLTVSAGLHKFQTLPYFARRDAGERMRFQKYTPKYEFTTMVFYGNYLPTGTGVIAARDLAAQPGRFRVAGTGVVLGFSQGYDVKKKLKLVGEPFKVFKNTAFIKGMFGSAVEVTKFIGAKIRTVSGVRGQVKKAVNEGPPGSFRATFEDKILLSDVVFCACWHTLQLERFYNPLSDFYPRRTLLNTAALRRRLGLAPPQDAGYAALERPQKVFMPAVAPPRLRAALPFKSREKVAELPAQRRLLQSETLVAKTLSTPQEKEARFFIQRLKLIKKEQDRKKQAGERQKRAWREKWEEGMNRQSVAERKKRTQEQMKRKMAGQARRQAAPARD